MKKFGVEAIQKLSQNFLESINYANDFQPDYVLAHANHLSELTTSLLDNYDLDIDNLYQLEIVYYAINKILNKKSKKTNKIKKAATMMKSSYLKVSEKREELQSLIRTQNPNSKVMQTQNINSEIPTQKSTYVLEPAKKIRQRYESDFRCIEKTLNELKGTTIKYPKIDPETLQRYEHTGKVFSTTFLDEKYPILNGMWIERDYRARSNKKINSNYNGTEGENKAKLGIKNAELVSGKKLINGNGATNAVVRFFVGQGLDNQEDNIMKIYCAIKDDSITNFTSQMANFAKNNDVSFEGKFYTFDNQFSHNKLVLYANLNQFGELAKFLINNKESFYNIEMNHPLGIQIVPGVSAVISGENKIRISFDESIKDSLEDISDGRKAIMSMLSNPVTAPHIAFLLTNGMINPDVELVNAPSNKINQSTKITTKQKNTDALWDLKKNGLFSSEEEFQMALQNSGHSTNPNTPRTEEKFKISGNKRDLLLEEINWLRSQEIISDSQFKKMLNIVISKKIRNHKFTLKK